MPTLTVSTNVAKVPGSLGPALSKAVAEVLSKPESYVAVHIQPGQSLFWGGTSEPAALCTLSSIGQISSERNKQSSKAIQSLIQSQLGIPLTRQYLVFVDLKKENVGYQATTFDALF